VAAPASHTPVAAGVTAALSLVPAHPAPRQPAYELPAGIAAQADALRAARAPARCLDAACRICADLRAGDRALEALLARPRGGYVQGASDSVAPRRDVHAATVHAPAPARQCEAAR
jgi:hypothetical protein